MGFVVPYNVVVIIVNRPQTVRVDYFIAEFAIKVRNVISVYEYLMYIGQIHELIK